MYEQRCFSSCSKIIRRGNGGDLSMHALMRLPLQGFFKLIIIFILALALSPKTLFAKTIHAKKAEWTVYIYLQANNNLRDFAAENLAEIAAIGSSTHANILIQLENPEENTHWRYRVEKGKIEFERVFTNTPTNSGKSIIEFTQWGHKNYPSNKHFLLLWNHGLGIIDPGLAWGWGTRNQGYAYPSYHAFLEKASPMHDKNYRGILFNESTRTYLNNQDMREMLKGVTQVFGKKLDILGMDACFMSGVESIYQSREYADVYLGSADIEPALGWQYTPFIKQITQGGANSVDLGHTIVQSFENLYKPYDGMLVYTQTGVIVSKIELLREAVDNLTAALFNCIRKGKADFKQLIHKARQQCLQYHNSSFIDLHSFCATLHGFIDEIKNTSGQKAQSNIQLHFGKLGKMTELKELQERLKETQTNIAQSIFSHVSCEKLSRGKGLSIYYPQKGGIDTSYPKTEFAKDSLWLAFLYEMLAN